MSTTNIKSVEDIYQLAPGGVLGIAIKLKCNPITIHRWSELGIPDRYWDPLHKYYGITPFELFRLNGKLRGYSTKTR